MRFIDGDTVIDGPVAAFAGLTDSGSGCALIAAAIAVTRQTAEIRRANDDRARSRIVFTDLENHAYGFGARPDVSCSPCIQLRAR